MSDHSRTATGAPEVSTQIPGLIDRALHVKISTGQFEQITAWTVMCGHRNPVIMLFENHDMMVIRVEPPAISAVPGGVGFD